MSYWQTLVWGLNCYGPSLQAFCLTQLCSVARARTSVQLLNRLEVNAVPLAFLIRNIIQIQGQFEQGGVYVDPTLVRLRLKRPDGTEVSPQPTPTKSAVGHYHYNFDTEGQAVGVWIYHWSGEGGYEAAAEGQFEVKASAFI